MHTETATVARFPFSPVRPDFRELDQLLHVVSTNGAVAALSPYGTDQRRLARAEAADNRRLNDAMGAVIAAGDLPAYSEWARFCKAKREAVSA
jgi:hypothetical protein